MEIKRNDPVHQYDADKWMEFIKGDERSFDYIYDKYFVLLYGYGMQLYADKAVIKDCIQDLFIELWSKKYKLAPVHFVKNYLYKSLRRKIIKVISQKDFSMLEYQMLSIGRDLQFSLSGESLLLEKEVIRSHEKAIQWGLCKLTSRQKEAIFLKFYENLSYEEIAAVMNLSDSKYVRKLVYRALKELKVTLHNFKNSLISTSLT